jgi:hypothetical protein
MTIKIGLQCELCDPGRYAPNISTPNCLAAPKGTAHVSYCISALNGSTQLRFTDPLSGYQQAGYGASSITVCPNGTYANVEGLSECFKCLPG